MLAAILEKLGKPGELLSPESRMEKLIGQMEIILGGKGYVTVNAPAPAGASGDMTALTARDVIAQMVEESKRQGIQSSNKAIVAKLNELGIRPPRSNQWSPGIIDNIKRRMKSKAKLCL